MKKCSYIIIILMGILFSLPPFVAKAETFESIINRLPPEKEDDIFSKTNYFLEDVNKFTGNIVDLLKSVNDVDVESFVSSINKIGDTFSKQRLDHRKQLEKERDEALATFNKVFESSSASDAEKADAALSLADAYFALNEIHAAENVVKRGLLLNDLSSTAPEKRVSLYCYLFDCHNALGNTERTKRLLKTMRTEYGSDTTSYGYGRYLRCSAIFSVGQGDYWAGYEKHKKSLRIFEANMDFPGNLRLIVEGEWEIGLLTIILQGWEVDEGAKVLVDYFNKIKKNNIIGEEELISLADGASILLMASGHPGSAFELIEEALKTTQKIYPDGSELELNLLSTVGTLILYNNELPEMKRTFNNFIAKGAHHYLFGCKYIAEKIWDKKNNGNNTFIHNINRNLAKTYMSKSAEGFRQAAKIYPDRGLLSVIAKPGSAEQEKYSRYAKLHNRAVFHAKRARQLYEEELEDFRINLHNRFLALNEGERFAYTSRMIDFCDAILSYAEDHRDDSNTRKMVYDVCLMKKSLLLDVSRSLSSIVRECGDPVILEKNDYLADLRDEITRAEQANASIGDLIRIENKVDAVEDEIILALAEKSSYDPARFILMTWKDVKKSLPQNSVAVEFYKINVTREDGHSFPAYRMAVLSNDKDPEIFSIQMLSSVMDTIISSPFNQMARWAISSNIWGALEKKKLISPKKRTNIFFAPEGLFHSIPIEYMPCEGTKSVAEIYNIMRVSSTRNLPSNHQALLSSSALYGDMQFDMKVENVDSYGDENISYMRADNGWGESLRRLPYTRDEVMAIHEIISPLGQSTVHTGHECMEENFKMLSGGDNKLIHIATHSITRSQENHPVNDNYKTGMNFTALAFNGAAVKRSFEDSGVDDGHLTSAEIALMDLSNTDMVVLSACSSGKGHIADEGVFGLQRGFKLAGVNTIVMSLWSVDDKVTSDLMTTFYKELAAGTSKRQALLKAQEFVKTQKYNTENGTLNGTNPKAWSGFIILD